MSKKKIEVSKSFDELFNRVDCDTGLIFVDTPEETRLIRELFRRYKGHSVQFWSLTQGLIEIPKDDDPERFLPHDYSSKKARLDSTGQLGSRGNIMNTFTIIEEDCRRKIADEYEGEIKTIYILRDADKFFQQPGPLRACRDLIYLASCASSSIIITGFGVQVPTDLEKDSIFIRIPYPTTEEITTFIIPNIQKRIERYNRIRSEKDKVIADFDSVEIARACAGLTEDQILNTIGYSTSVKREVNTDIILEEKRSVINKSDILEYWVCDTTLNDVGGFKELKNWFQVRKAIMNHPEEAKRFGAKPPKGIMLLGVQGSGKAQPLYTKILMEDKTFKELGSIKIGDIVRTPNGKTAKVVNIFEHKNKDNFRMQFVDGRYSESCDEHLWKVYSKDFESPECPDGWKIITTKEIIKLLEQKDETRKFYIPLLQDSQEDIDVPIEPYILGTLLGNESLRYNVEFPDSTHNGHEQKLTLELRRLKSKKDKFIPEYYFTTSLHQKMSLIQGLIKTSGSTNDGINIFTSSNKLAKDVQRLIWSMGGISTISNETTKYKVNIRSWNLKDNLSSDYQHADLKLEIKSVEYIGKEDMRCIMLDDEEHLYIIDDYIVTHNTHIAKSVAADLGVGVIKLEMGKVFAGLVGESVAPWTEFTFYDEHGQIFRMPAEEAYERKLMEHAPMFVQSFTREGKAQLLPVNDVIRHKRTKPLVKVTTKSGRSVDVTEDHSLFTISDNGKLEELTPSNMKKGSIIAVPSNYDQGNTLKQINLYRLITTNNDLDKWFLLNAYDKIGDKIFEITDPKSHSQYRNGRPLNLKYINDNILSSCGPQLLDGTTKIKAFSTTETHPMMLTLTPDFMQLCGWYTAEGSTTGDRLRLHVNKEEVDLVENIAIRNGYNTYSYQDKNTNGYTVFFGDTGLKRIFDYLELTQKDRIPSWILGTNTVLRSAYINGLFSGDGGISGNHIEFSQKNESLCNDVLELLASIGIFASKYPRLDGGFRIIIHSSVFKEKYMNTVGFSQLMKSELLETLFEEKDWGHKVPFFKALKDKSSSHDVNKSSEWISYKDAIKIDPTLAHSDIYWDVVESIKVLDEQPEFVYDISVPGNENFIAGNIICHNSEKRMRMALAQAAAAGGVVVIDEIDKGLSGAGSSDRTDGGTTSRVIGTLLTWMSEDHPNVFIVATANDISALNKNHPELLRKGRFDEIWFSDCPTEEEREEIFAIHLRRNKRDPNKFDLKKLAAVEYEDESSGNTYTYTGAEIEYAVQDAIQEKFAKGGGKLLEIGSKDDITTDDIAEKLTIIKPITFISRETIDVMRRWSSKHARRVSGSVEKTGKANREKTKNVNMRTPIDIGDVKI